MTEKYKNKYRVPSARLDSYDYASPGDYFITICVDNHRSVFGELTAGTMRLNALGAIASKFWAEIPLHYPNMSVDEYIIMPDHMHGLLSLDHLVDDPRSDLVRSGILRPRGAALDTRMRAISPLAGGIPAAVRSYKSAVKKWAGKNGYGHFAWQERYWDSVIRDDQDGLQRVRNYIRNNPRKAHTVDVNGDDT